MSRAIDQNGNMFDLLRYTRLELKELSKNKYYCIECKQRLILKVGNQNRPHFAHRSSVKKEDLIGESNHHKRATNLLYNHFKKQGIKTFKEYYIPEIKQRPDIVLFFNKKIYALEFQSSKINKKTFINRTINLIKAGYTPIWLLSSRLLIMKGQFQIKITPFILQFIHQFTSNSPPKLFFFNPEKQEVIILKHLIVISQDYAYVQKEVINLQALTLKKIKKTSKLNINLLFKIWKNEKYQYRTLVRGHSYGSEYKWRLWLYDKNLHFENLPSIIYLPTRENYYFKVPSWNWQSRLYLKILHPLKINESFSYNECLFHLNKYIIPHSNFPLIKHKTNPLLNYLKLLTHLQIIKPIAHNKYIKIKNVLMHKDLQESLNSDDDIINQLLYNLIGRTKI